MRLLVAQKNVEAIPVTRKNISGWCRVSDYSLSPTGDVLIHLAEENERVRATQSGQAYEEKTLATLAALLGKGYRRVVYASSSVLYGDADIRPHFPDDPIQVDDAYSHVKRLSELAVLKSPSGVVARLANIYGPGMSKGNVLSTILRQISSKGSLKVLDTSPRRDFIWVEDAAEGLVALALNYSKGDNERRVFNLGTGVGTSIGSLASMVLEIVGQPTRQVEAKCVSGRKSCLVLDYSDTTSACGWQPRTSLRQGLSHILNMRKE